MIADVCEQRLHPGAHLVAALRKISIHEGKHKCFVFPRYEVAAQRVVVGQAACLSENKRWVSHIPVSECARLPTGGQQREEALAWIGLQQLFP